MAKEIIAAYDEEGIFVYQAFKPLIADSALAQGTFGKGFNLDRLTWIKPSFGWMLYRSHYATKHRQERILRIKVIHEGFCSMLHRGIPTYFDPTIFTSEQEWREALKKTEVRYQWDPDRDLFLRPLDRRAIQLGIAGQSVRRYVNEWIVGLEDVTALAKSIHDAIRKSALLPTVLPEVPYRVSEEIQHQLGMVGSSADPKADSK